MVKGPRLDRIVLPTQLPVGPVNAYLLRNEGDVLVDTGPRLPGSFKRLEKELGKLGTGIKDLDVVLITHGHVDHYGQAGEIASESGAEVWVHELDKNTVADFAQTYDQRSEFHREKFLKTGISAETLRLVRRFFDYVKGLASASPVHKTFKDGDILNLAGWDFEVIHTPGHSAGSACLQHGTTLLSGDTVLKHITPNAAFGGADGESVGMADYLESLDRLAECDVQTVYTGHGPLVNDLAGFIATYKDLYWTRRQTLLDFLDRGDRTTMEMVNHLFGSLPVQEIFLGVTETLGHIEIFEREGLVDSKEREGTLFYTKTAPS